MTEQVQALNPVAAFARKMSKASERLAYMQREELHGMNFKYLPASEVNRRVNLALVEVKLAVVSTDMAVIGDPGRLSTVRVIITLADMDTGYTSTFSGVSSGHDPGDKGTAKAVTTATKALWMTAFVVCADDDSPTEVEGKRVSSQTLERCAECASLDEAVAVFSRHRIAIASGGKEVEKTAKAGLLSLAKRKGWVTEGKEVEQLTAAFKRVKDDDDE